MDQDGEPTVDDAAAWNIGDAVPFQLTATTADNVAAYKKYHITFQDKQSEGLDAPTTFKVTVLGKEFIVPATGNDPNPQTTTDGTKITVTKAEVEENGTFAIKVEFEPTGEDEYLNAECNSIEITVDYTAVLNSNAEIGAEGNSNDSHITYSNNPEDEDGGDEGKTPDDTVKVFTYKTVIDKVDADGNALENAGFTLYLEVEEGTNGAVEGSSIQFADGVEHSKISAEKFYIVKAMTTVSGNEAQFDFQGLADGKYVLVETTIPTGFNAFNSVEFTISSTVTEEEITELTGGTPFETTNPGEDGAVEAEKKDGTTHALDSGELYAEIENNSGQVLPSTGGIGTTIFYIVGAILVIGAGVIMITRRRMEAN
jgi:fimbrial isopeptide formation D2 family protein/LPXTG-motif cell wall-anchored protein